MTETLRKKSLPWLCAALPPALISTALLVWFAPWAWGSAHLYYDLVGHDWMLDAIRRGWSFGEATTRDASAFYGMPILRYYYPLVPYAAAALGWLIGDGGALGWLHALPVVAIPLAGFWAVKRGGAPPLGAMWAALASAVLVAQLPMPRNATEAVSRYITFGSKAHIWGGLRESVFSGPYTTSWAVLILIIALGIWAKPNTRKTIGWSDAGIGALLAALVMCQPYLAAVGVAVSAVVLWRRWGRLFFTWCAAGVLFAWWAGPSLIGPLLGAMTHRNWEQLGAIGIGWGWVGGEAWWGLPLGAALYALAAWGWKGLRGRKPFLAAAGCVFLLYEAFALLPPGIVWNHRWLTVWAPLVVLGGGLGISRLGRGKGGEAALWTLGAGTASAVAILIAASYPFAYASPAGIAPAYANVNVAPGWTLPSWSALYQSHLGGKDVSTVFFEQSPVAPFAEAAQVGFWPPGDNELGGFSPRGKRGRTGWSIRAAGALGADRIILGQYGPYGPTVNSATVEAFRKDGWLREREGDREGEYMWRSPDGPAPLAIPLRSVPFRGGGSFLVAAEAQFLKDPEVWLTDGDFAPPPHPCPAPVAEEIDHRTIRLEGTPGCPVLVRAAWIPGWRSSDGSEIARAGPFIALSPKENEVELRWGRSWDERASVAVSVAGIPLMGWLFLYLHRRRRPSPPCAPLPVVASSPCPPARSATKGTSATGTGAPPRR